MDFSEWEPFYKEILTEMGFSAKADRSAAETLRKLLPKPRDPSEELRRILRGKEVIIVGAGPRSFRLEMPLEGVVTIAADGATTYCLEDGFRPDVIVTDLDGNIADELKANKEGSFTLIHAHGDNVGALKKWVPRFQGKVGGSVPTAPTGGTVNFGGFTDGDRALFLAEAMGATTATLAMFDFATVPEGKLGELRKKKLVIAKRLIDGIVARGKIRVLVRTSSGVRDWKRGLP